MRKGFFKILYATASWPVLLALAALFAWSAWRIASVARVESAARDAMVLGMQQREALKGAEAKLADFATADLGARTESLGSWLLPSGPDARETEEARIRKTLKDHGWELLSATWERRDGEGLVQSATFRARSQIDERDGDERAAFARWQLAASRLWCEGPPLEMTAMSAARSLGGWLDLKFTLRFPLRESLRHASAAE